MSRVSKGKVRYLKRVFALKQFYSDFMISGKLDLFAIVNLMGTNRTLSRLFRVTKPTTFKSHPLWSPPSLESFDKAGEIMNHVMDSLTISRQQQTWIRKDTNV